MVSPRKPATTVSPVPVSKSMATSAKSCESLFSACSSRESACLIYQRKQPQVRGGCMKPSNGSGGHGPVRQPSIIPNSSDIHQRVMSARNLRIKTFQNQLANAQAEIANLAHENRMLRTLHKRQSSALSKYESTNAELPQLLHSHAEELRVWQTKYRNLQALNKELEAKIKQKEALILSLSDQNKHYSQLNKDRNLDERQRLQEKLRNLEQRLIDKDNDMKLMARKVQLESKNFRQQLLNEQKKSKEVMLKLEKARLEISGYRKLEEFTLGGEKSNPLSSGRRTKLNVVEEPEKIEKLEKSLETLEEAIEKNNQSEFNALTDVLETDSLFDFEKEEKAEEESAPSSPHKSVAKNNNNAGTKNNTTGQDTKIGRGGNSLSKLLLPPATVQPKQSHQPTTRSSLSQALSNKASSVKATTSIPRLRSGGTKNSTIPGSSSALSSLASKRREPDAISRISAPEPKSKQNALKSLEMNAALGDDYDFDDDFERGAGGDDSFGLIAEMCADDDCDDNEENANEASLLSYAGYMEQKSTNGDLDDMLDDDEDEDEGRNPRESVITKGFVRTASMKEDISSIHKQISDDYKERESFLNTFCRQASSSNMREDPALKKRNSIATGATSHMAGSRKNALLAALKAIDDNKSQD
ncbi:uncharacterized protein LOC115632492 [Scaptodrosophila lebanonensis]|uniref:Uncharacterized protein LOC115632492 n=1 Tax=Drosophila lebanonensis TaxID=7225 RepID=A0A6J2UBT5_DROLE|nr:uncharacterized protein LOC115632492 [Scaptodrosophila lebanonensis]